MHFIAEWRLQTLQLKIRSTVICMSRIMQSQAYWQFHGSPNLNNHPHDIGILLDSVLGGLCDMRRWTR